MELVSEFWGGWYSCLIPTDGQKIDEPFWFLLKHFDPDYFYIFQDTIGDIKFWDQTKYDELVKTEKERLNREKHDIHYFDDYFENVFVGTPIEPFEILETLKMEISHRLNPFHYRGFIFKCQHCKNAAWYSIENVTYSFFCNRCNHEQRYDKRHMLSSHEPQWYYKLDEVIYQGYLHEMMVPVLTLKYLKSISKSSFYYLPEIEIRSSPSQKPEIELDICCCIDGKVIIGQCTKKDSLENTAVEEKRRLNKNKEISQAVKADEFILSTSSPNWKEGTISRAKSIFSESKIEIKFITKSEIF